MSVYANKTIIDLEDVIARLTFVDEKAPIQEGLPPQTSRAAEVVMTVGDLEALGASIERALRRHRA